jgi:hypothetical protein
LFKRRNAEYAAEVEKMKEEAAEKRKAGKGTGESGGRGRKKTLGKRLPKVSDARARAVGTNRAYVETAAKLDDAELEAVRDGKKKMPEVIRERKPRGAGLTGKPLGNKYPKGSSAHGRGGLIEPFPNFLGKVLETPTGAGAGGPQNRLREKPVSVAPTGGVADGRGYLTDRPERVE